MRRRRGITGTLEQALLIAVTVAFFLGIVVAPMANAAKFIWEAPQNAWESWSGFVEWVDGLIDSMFQGGEQGNASSLALGILSFS